MLERGILEPLMSSTVVSAVYTFLHFDSDGLERAKEGLFQLAEETGLRGLVVLGNEGLNGTVAGTPEAITAFKGFVQKLAGDTAPEFKDATAEKQPFNRFKIDVRPEIVTSGQPIRGGEAPKDSYLSPAEWHEILESGEDIALVDTRNFYETAIGTFTGAIDPKISKFSEFPEFLESSGIPKDKKLLLFCTGGIRCEKAVVSARRAGFENAYQLHGGILKYLETYPKGRFEGECFVFDHRVAVDGELQPSKTYKLCPHCGNPAKEQISCEKCGTGAIVCEGCLQEQHRRTCSKNCAHHRKLALAKKVAGEDRTSVVS